MSYDVSIGDESFNYTSNVSQLFYDHIPKERSVGGIHELDGLTGAAAARLLGETFERISQTRLLLWTNDVGEPAFCKKYDNANGWGSAIGGILFLANIMGACVANPRSRVRVSA
jgi:hypothetical protein